MPEEVKAGDSKAGSGWLVGAQAWDMAFPELGYYIFPSAHAWQLAQDRNCHVNCKRYRDTGNLEGEEHWHLACS